MIKNIINRLRSRRGDSRFPVAMPLTDDELEKTPAPPPTPTSRRLVASGTAATAPDRARPTTASSIVVSRPSTPSI